MLFTLGLRPTLVVLAANLSVSSWTWSWYRVAGNGVEMLTSGNGTLNVAALLSASDSNPGLLGGASDSVSRNSCNVGKIGSSL